MLWYVMFVFSPWDPSTKPINTPCRTQITRGATQTPLCMPLLSPPGSIPTALQTADTAQGRAKVVYWQRCALSHKLQAAALTHPDKEAQICLPPTTHKSLWAQKVQFRCCVSQYEYHSSISIVNSKFLSPCKWIWGKFVSSK